MVEALALQGHESVVLARSKGVDLTTGTGLDAALDGVDAVIDVANVLTRKATESVAWFEAATTRLLAAAARARVTHLVALSIVAVHRVDLGYYLGKRRQEALLLAADTAVPTSVLCATQFHEFAGQLLSSSHGPIALMPKMRSKTCCAPRAYVARPTSGPGCRSRCSTRVWDRSIRPTG